MKIMLSHNSVEISSIYHFPSYAFPICDLILKIISTKSTLFVHCFSYFPYETHNLIEHSTFENFMLFLVLLQFFVTIME